MMGTLAEIAAWISLIAGAAATIAAVPGQPVMAAYYATAGLFGAVLFGALASLIKGQQRLYEKLEAVSWKMGQKASAGR